MELKSTLSLRGFIQIRVGKSSPPALDPGQGLCLTRQMTLPPQEMGPQVKVVPTCRTQALALFQPARTGSAHPWLEEMRFSMGGWKRGICCNKTFLAVRHRGGWTGCNRWCPACSWVSSDIVCRTYCMKQPKLWRDGSTESRHHPQIHEVLKKNNKYSAKICFEQRRPACDAVRI